MRKKNHVEKKKDAENKKTRSEKKDDENNSPGTKYENHPRKRLLRFVAGFRVTCKTF
jgi:hypothetical protein